LERENEFVKKSFVASKSNNTPKTARTIRTDPGFIFKLSYFDPHTILRPFTSKAGVPLSRRDLFMSKFMVRVILHDRPTAPDYDRLDMAMCESGFLQELAGKRATYHLPNGEYWYTGKTNASDVRTRAASAARTLGREFGVIAVRVDGWSLMGLKKVTSASPE
jgi:hypothetical protein